MIALYLLLFQFSCVKSCSFDKKIFIEYSLLPSEKKRTVKEKIHHLSIYFFLGKRIFQFVYIFCLSLSLSQPKIK
jgi:hypothetical protein